MRISEKKHTELYKSFSDPIMDLRVEISMDNNSIEISPMDKKLFDLEREIHRRIVKTLNLTKP